MPHRSRRERFKVAVFSVLAVHLVFLLILLTQGYRSGATLVDIPSGEPAGPPSSPTDRAMAAEQKPVPWPAGSPTAASRSSTADSQLLAESVAQSAPPAVVDSEGAQAISPDTIYVVKSGDTLSGIARTYGTSVKGLMAANRLTSDRLSIGMKLRIPGPKLLAASGSSLAEAR